MEGISIPVTRDMIDCTVGLREEIDFRMAEMTAIITGTPLPVRPWEYRQRQSLSEFTAHMRATNPRVALHRRINAVRKAVAWRLWPSDENWCDCDPYDD